MTFVTPDPEAINRAMEAMKPMAARADLPEAALRGVAQIAVFMRRGPGAILQVEGEPAQAMFIVLRGRVKILRSTPAGREQVIHVAGPGDHINVVPVVDGGKCPATVQTLTEAEVFALPVKDLREYLLREPRLAMMLLANLARNHRKMVNLIEDLALHTVQSRLAKLLLDRAHNANKGEDVPPLTQAEMAEQLGTVREMVARSLKTFEGLGLIQMERGRIAVLDADELHRLAEIKD
jgi:CRP-like cAMP-binding protein